MIRNAKNWKLEVVLEVRANLSSHEDVLGPTFEKERLRVQEIRDKEFRDKRYEILHILRETPSKTANHTKGRRGRAGKKKQKNSGEGNSSADDK